MFSQETSSGPFVHEGGMRAMPMTKALVLQNEEAAPPGLLAAWADSRQIGLDVVQAYRETPLPDPASYSFAVTLGSYASLTGAGPAWVRRELEWLRRADRSGLAVLGICFGAQAVAVAHGGRVSRLAAPEIAWIELDSADERAVPKGPWLAVHEDTITLPPLAYELARTAGGLQAFSVGRHLAVQFHPEVTPAILSSWLGVDPGRLTRAGVQRAPLERQTRELAAEAAVSAYRLFDSFALSAGVSLDELESANIGLV
jgi:GMP synthase-like glutamine amidotransferase